MPWLLGLWTMLVVLNYAAAPGHRLAFEDLTGFLLPRHGTFSTVTLLDSWISRGRAVAVWGTINAGVGGAGLVATRLLGVRPGLVRTWLMGLAPASLLMLGLGLTGLLHP